MTDDVIRCEFHDCDALAWRILFWGPHNTGPCRAACWQHQDETDLSAFRDDCAPSTATPGTAEGGVGGVGEHAIRWEFDDGCVTATAVCHADPEADCHLTSVTCECERWGDIQRRDDGTIWHHIVDYGDSLEPVWHEVKLMDDCNVCLFINESGCVEELAVRGTRIDLGETPIQPVWLDDGCDWEPVPTPEARAETEGGGR